MRGILERERWAGLALAANRLADDDNAANDRTQ